MMFREESCAIQYISELSASPESEQKRVYPVFAETGIRKKSEPVPYLV